MAESREILAIEIREDGSLVCKRNIESIGDSAVKTQSAVDALKLALATYASGVTLHGIMELTDEFITAQNEIRVLYGEGKNLNEVNRELLRIANEARVPLEGVYHSFNKIMLGAEEMGISERKAMDLTEALNLALVPFGASSTQAASAIQQISMALATGGPGGVAFRSMLRQASEAMLVLSEHFHVSRGEMRQWVTDGRLSSEMIVEGLTANLEKLREKVAQTNYTFAQSMTVVKNSVQTALGTLNEMSGAGNGLHSVMMVLTEDQTAFTGATAALLTVLGSVGLILTIAGVVLGITKLAAVISGATSVLLGFSIAAGPLLLILLAVGLAVGAAVMIYRDLTESTKELNDEAEKEKALTKIQVDLKEKLVGSIEKLKLENEGLNRLLKDGSISLEKYNHELAKNEADKYAQSVDRTSGALRAQVKIMADLTNESIAGEQAYNRLWEAAAKGQRLDQVAVSLTEMWVAEIKAAGGATELSNKMMDELNKIRIERLDVTKPGMAGAVEAVKLKQERGFGTSGDIGALTTQEAQFSQRMSGDELANRIRINKELLKQGAIDQGQYLKRMDELSVQFWEQSITAQDGYNAALTRGMVEQRNLAKGAGEAVQEYMNKLSPEQFAAKMEAFDKLARENPGDAQRIGFLKAAASIDYYSNSLDKAAGQIRALNKSNQEWDNEAAISEAAMTHALDSKIKAQHKARIEQETYNDALAAGNITLAEYTNLMAESQINALEKATDAQSGYTRGFLKVGQGIRDMATSSEKVVTDAFGGMEDAVVGFVKTGKLDFSGLVDSMLEDMTRLLMKQAMNGLFGSFGSGGGGVSGLVGGIGSMLGFAGGGDPPVGQPSIVGERGPEIFVPKTAGTVVPNVSAAVPQIKVVNVHDPKDAVSAMNSAGGEQVVLNIIKRNRTALQRELS